MQYFNMGRIIGGIVAGLLAGGIIQIVVEIMGHNIFPPPEAVMQGDRQALASYIQNAPLPVLLFPLLAILLGNLSGGLIGTAISKSFHTPALVIGIFFTIGSVINVITIPHPAWVGILYVILPVPAALAGGKAIALTLNKRGLEFN